jgi:CheY-like chemotaxis protein
MNAVCASDVIILDLMMRLGSKINPAEAGETGTALYKRIRTFAPNIPVVVLTARSKSEVWDDFAGDNHACYLGKPVSDTEEFYDVIEKGGRNGDQ